MIELRADGSIPGPAAYGRVYQVVNLMTGEVGYNCWLSDLPQGDHDKTQRIEAYDTFRGYASDILPADEVKELVRTLNRTKVFVDTPHTLLVQRVRQRLAQGLDGDVDGFGVLQDMAEMLEDIEGRRERPALPGWNR